MCSGRGLLGGRPGRERGGGSVKLRNCRFCASRPVLYGTVLFQCQAAAFDTAQIRRMKQRNLRLRSFRV